MAMRRQQNATARANATATANATAKSKADRLAPHTGAPRQRRAERRSLRRPRQRQRQKQRPRQRHGNSDGNGNGHNISNGHGKSNGCPPKRQGGRYDGNSEVNGHNQRQRQKALFNYSSAAKGSSAIFWARLMATVSQRW
jgi:hypothetical protein